MTVATRIGRVITGAPANTISRSTRDSTSGASDSGKYPLTWAVARPAIANVNSSSVHSCAGRRHP